MSRRSQIYAIAWVSQLLHHTSQIILHFFCKAPHKRGYLFKTYVDKSDRLIKEGTKSRRQDVTCHPKETLRSVFMCDPICETKWEADIRSGKMVISPSTWYILLRLPSFFSLAEEEEPFANPSTFIFNVLVKPQQTPSAACPFRNQSLFLYILRWTESFEFNGSL